MFKPYSFSSLLLCAGTLFADSTALEHQLGNASDSTETPLRSSDSGYELSRGEKVIITNATAAALLITWGVTQWGYFSNSLHFKDEGWFENDTSSGGADKLGHLYSAYLITRILAPLYDGWGYSRDDAALYAAASSIFLTVGVIEIGDGTSDAYGFSCEDAIADTIGAVIGYFWYRYPPLAKLIDLRVEWVPDFGKSDQGTDFTTDYENMKHLIAVKGEGIGAFENTYLEYAELHLGYFGRNFHDNGAPGDYHPIPPNETERYIYVGLGINLSRLLRPVMGDYAGFFNYYQTPYTYIAHEWEIE